MKIRPDDPDDLADFLTSLAKRVKRLEDGNVLENAAFDDGPIECYDSATGLLRVQIGKLPNGKFGFRIYEPNGTTVNFEQSDT